MTQTIDAPVATLSPQERVDAWLADFEAALAARDAGRVVGKFTTDSFWPDLVAFTWNIKTVEGRDGRADMLTTRLAETDPSGSARARRSVPTGGRSAPSRRW
jgi:putative flavoprotein involved in K+ transport